MNTRPTTPATPPPDWHAVAARLGLADAPVTPRPPPPCRCLELNEPCSPACFSSSGFRAEHFADFIAALRNEREGVPPLRCEAGRDAEGRTVFEALLPDVDGNRARWTEGETPNAKGGL